MELGHCPRCATPYTASEVAGFGVLRGRRASAGGPRMEYRCQDCGRLIRLVAHGEGRYAPPGQPPPSWVPESERRPPWVGEPTDAAPSAPPEPAPAPEERQAQPEVQAEPAVAGLPTDPAAAMGYQEALALLGVPPGADPDAIERAFRERSLTCHPDKVAHLDLEFQVLAETKFRRLKQAFDLLSP